RDQRFHQSRAGLYLQKLDCQSALRGEAAFVDHRDEAGIALGFEDAMLPDFFLRLGSVEATQQRECERQICLYSWRREHESSGRFVWSCPDLGPCIHVFMTASKARRGWGGARRRAASRSTQ